MKKTTYTTLYVGNLLYTRDSEDLKELFSQYGKVNSVKMITDPYDTGKKKGYAFVQMAKLVDAQKAIKDLNLASVDGRTMKVSIATSRDEKIQLEINQELKKAPSKIEKKAIARKPQPTVKKNNGLDVLFNYLNTKKSVK